MSTIVPIDRKNVIFTKLSDEDEALIKHTLRTLAFITLDTNSDDDETRLLRAESIAQKTIKP